MLKRFAGNLKLHWQTPIGLLACLLGFFLFGFVMICVILGTDRTAVSWGTLGAIFGVMGVVLFSILSFLSYAQDFMLALSLGRTRKEFMMLYAAEWLLWMAAAYVGLMLMAWLESGLYTVLFPHAYEEFSLLPVLADWRVAATAIPVLVVLPMFFGALYSRFGKRFGVILYIVWMGGCLLLPRMANYFETQGAGSFFGWLLKIPAAGWAGIGIAVLAVIAVITVRLGRKQMVR